jgi:hypothetical protein
LIQDNIKNEVDYLNSFTKETNRIVDAKLLEFSDKNEQLLKIINNKYAN